MNSFEEMKPRLYSQEQFKALSQIAKKKYLEKIIQYNENCETLGVPERKIDKEFE